MKRQELLRLTPKWWRKLLKMWLEELENEEYDINNITYIKEKYGMMRIEANIYNDIFSSLEAASWYICEKCGKIGRTRYDLYWYRTLCNKCRNNSNYWRLRGCK